MMTNGFDDRFLHDLLGLGPDDRVEELARAPSIASDVGEGLSYDGLTARSRPGVEASLVALARQAPLFTPVDTVNSELGQGKLEQWDCDPRVFRLLGIVTSAIVSGRIEATPGGNWMIDARGDEPAVLRFPDAGVETVLIAQRGELRCFRVLRFESGDALARRLDEFRPRAAVELSVPAPEDLLEHLSPAEWLLERARRLHESPALHERVASVGLVARLGAGTTREPGKVLEALLGGGYRSPTAKALEWARGLGQDLVDIVERRALELVDDLEQDLETLEGIVVEGGPAAERAALAIRHRRDELESIAWVLRAAKRTEVIEPELEALDREAAVHLSAIDLARGDEDDLLACVSWQEPHAWWGEPRGS